MLGERDRDKRHNWQPSRRELLTLAGWAATSWCMGQTRETEQRPNVVLILADDLGYAGIGCQGARDIPTPHIDGLAAAGVRLTSGYVTCPVCAPTRAGLLTGRYQQRFGFETNPGPQAFADPNFGLPQSEKTLAERLKDLGYVTGMFGKWHVGYRTGLRPTERGFDEFYGFLSGAHDYLTGGMGVARQAMLRGTKQVQEHEYLTDAFGREAVSFIERHRDRPFFLYLPFNAVHAPLQADSKYLKRFDHIANEKRRIHCAMVSALDDNVGRVLEALRRHGLEERTLVIFLSDNGGPTPQTTASNAPLRGFKGQLWEGGIRVPFIMQWKGKLPAGKVYDAPVSALDIVPTVMAATGKPVPASEELDGVDLTPYLMGTRSGEPHEVLYWRFQSQRAIRKGDWKLVRTLQDSRWRLYHLRSDIGESRDLSEREPGRVRELQEAWNAWNAELKNPLWRREGGRSLQRLRSGPANLEARFRELDKNSDGKLTPDEFGRPRIFRQMDRNDDGSVTLEEAQEFWSRRARGNAGSSSGDTGPGEGRG